MSDDRLDKEYKALQRLMKLMEEAKEVRQMFDEAGSPLPAPLARLMGEGGFGDGGGRSRSHIKPMASPPRPRAAKDDWIWVPEHELSTAKLAIAVLRLENRLLSPNELFDKLRERRPDANKGSVFNIGPRLDGDLITRTAEGWVIKDATRVPMLVDGVAWGSPEVFAKNEIAGHRRAVILHILSLHPEGLRMMPLVKHLQQSGLCKAPCSKDLVKGDMLVLEREEKVSQNRTTRKWSLAKE